MIQKQSRIDMSKMGTAVDILKRVTYLIQEESTDCGLDVTCVWLEMTKSEDVSLIVSLHIAYNPDNRKGELNRAVVIESSPADAFEPFVCEFPKYLSKDIEDLWGIVEDYINENYMPPSFHIAEHAIDLLEGAIQSTKEPVEPDRSILTVNGNSVLWRDRRVSLGCWKETNQFGLIVDSPNRDWEVSSHFNPVQYPDPFPEPTTIVGSTPKCELISGPNHVRLTWDGLTFDLIDKGAEEGLSVRWIESGNVFVAEDWFKFIEAVLEDGRLCLLFHTNVIVAPQEAFIRTSNGLLKSRASVGGNNIFWDYMCISLAYWNSGYFGLIIEGSRIPMTKPVKLPKPLSIDENVPSFKLIDENTIEMTWGRKSFVLSDLDQKGKFELKLTAYEHHSHRLINKASEISMVYNDNLCLLFPVI